jgi:hypothetical protein
VDEIIGTLVEKAQSETHFAAMYAKLCLRLSEARLPAFQDEKVRALSDKHCVTVLLSHQCCYILQTCVSKRTCMLFTLLITHVFESMPASDTSLVVCCSH